MIEKDLIDTLSNAYFFTVRPVPELEFVIQRWVSQGRLTNDILQSDTHASNAFKVLLLLTISLVTEAGRLQETKYYLPFDELCNVVSWKDQVCLTIQSNNAIKYTHAILYMIMKMRSGKWIDDKPLDESVTQSFIDSISVILHAILLMRLAYHLVSNPYNESEREKPELLVFITIISFYGDFVPYTQKFTSSGDLQLKSMYDVMLAQITNLYLSPEKGIFREFELNYPLKAYLDQDYILNIRSCVDTKFLMGNNARSIISDRDPEMTNVLNCLYNINVNALRKRFNVFIRSIVDNPVCRGVTGTISWVRGAYNWIADIPARTRNVFTRGTEFGCSLTDSVFLKEFPKTSFHGRIRRSLLFIQSPLVNATNIDFISTMETIFKVAASTFGISKELVTGIYNCVYTVKSTDFAYLTKNGKLEFERPVLNGMLVRVRNRSGSFNTIFTFHQLPIINLIDTFDNNLYGGGITENIGTDLTQKELYDMFKKGYVAEELPVEHQTFINTKIKTHGGDLEESFTMYMLTDNTDYIQTIITKLPDVAGDLTKANLVIQGDNCHIVLPEVPLLADAILHADMHTVASPARGDISENNIPDPLPSMNETIVPTYSTPSRNYTTRTSVRLRKSSKKRSTKKRTTKKQITKKQTTKKCKSSKKRKSTKRSRTTKQRKSSKKRKLTKRKRTTKKISNRH